MSPDQASRERVAALRAQPASTVPPASDDPDAPTARVAQPVEARDPTERPDPEFWGDEPRRVRRTHRAEPAVAPATRQWWSGLVDRVRSARVEVGIGVAVMVVVVFVAGVVWYRMGVDAGNPPRRAATDRDASTGSEAVGTAIPAGATAVTVTTSPAAAHRGDTIVVHVAGAVVRPGVLLMPAGARVIDAVEGAGGGTPEADLDRLNLAAKLIDGQRILVTKVGAAPVADPAAVSDPATDPGVLIDLNSATSAQLESLPGIGPALARAILAERDRRGGFRSINELREVRGIGEARFADLRERVSL